MSPVGFEPTHVTILELESSALDHSAIATKGGLNCGSIRPEAGQNKTVGKWVQDAPPPDLDSGEIRTLALKEQWISSPSP